MLCCAHAPVDPLCATKDVLTTATLGGRTLFGHFDTTSCAWKVTGLNVTCQALSDAGAAGLRLCISVPAAGRCSTLQGLCGGATCVHTLTSRAYKHCPIERFGV